MPRKKENLAKTFTLGVCLTAPEHTWLNNQKYCGETTSQCLRRLLTEKMNTDVVIKQSEKHSKLETIPF